MKTIKFRVWDKLDKTMYSIREIDFLADGKINSIRTVIPYLLNDGETIDFDFPIRRDGEYELMQFTGLTDKNGKEIYEGDIVEWDDSIPEEMYGGKIEYYHEAVIFEDGCFMPVYAINSFCEVIGNIYENPELLK